VPTVEHQGSLGAELSLLQVKGGNVVITAMKKAEDDDALIVRFYEWAGKEGEVTLQLPPGAKSAVDADLMERPMGRLPLHDGAVTVATKPYEIKTLKVQFENASPPAWRPEPVSDGVSSNQDLGSAPR